MNFRYYLTDRGLGGALRETQDTNHRLRAQLQIHARTLDALRSRKSMLEFNYKTGHILIGGPQRSQNMCFCCCWVNSAKVGERGVRNAPGSRRGELSSRVLWQLG